MALGMHRRSVMAFINPSLSTGLQRTSEADAPAIGINVAKRLTQRFTQRDLEQRHTATDKCDKRTHRLQTKQRKHTNVHEQESVQSTITDKQGGAKEMAKAKASRLIALVGRQKYALECTLNVLQSFKSAVP